MIATHLIHADHHLARHCTPEGSERAAATQRPAAAAPARAPARAPLASAAEEPAAAREEEKRHERRRGLDGDFGCRLGVSKTSSRC